MPKCWSSLPVSGLFIRQKLQALVHHPLVPSVRVAKLMLDDMLEAHRRYLPAFFSRA